jgi:hypothetical protein
LIYIWTLTVGHVQLFRTVYGIFVNSFRDLRIKKTYVGDSETVTKHCLNTYNV